MALFDEPTSGLAPSIDAPSSLRDDDALRWFERVLGRDQLEKIERESRIEAARISDRLEWRIYKWVGVIANAAERSGISYAEVRGPLAEAIERELLDRREAEERLAGERTGSESTTESPGGEAGDSASYRSARFKTTFSSFWERESWAKEKAERGPKKNGAHCTHWKYVLKGQSCSKCVPTADVVFPAGSPIWQLLRPPMHADCDCELHCSDAPKFDYFPLPPPHTEEAAKNVCALKAELRKQTIAVQYAMDLANEAKIPFIQAPDGSWLPTSLAARGPCLSVAVNLEDPKNPKFAFRVNTDHVPNPIPSCMAERIKRVVDGNSSYYKSPAAIARRLRNAIRKAAKKVASMSKEGSASAAEQSPDPVSADDPKFAEHGFDVNNGYPGQHSEVHAVAAVLSHDCSSMKHVAIYNARLLKSDTEGTKVGSRYPSKINTTRGEDMKRCPHCASVLGDGHDVEDHERSDPKKNTKKAKGARPEVVQSDSYSGVIATADPQWKCDQVHRSDATRGEPE